MANNFYISILFDSSSKSYYFATDDANLKLDDYVVVETTIGKEIGHVIQEPKPIETLKFDFEVKPILRKALPSDMQIYNENKKLAKEASALFEENIKTMNLDMRLLSSEYTLDRTKILFIYASETRIDFRELLKILASKLHCRIELKQINARERAQAIGGIGICGLPICCATFFKTFDGISITRAKNQMLTINIPKLSGLCGKLMCCLKYEDDLYTDLKQEFPPVGTFVTYENEKYKVTGFNVLTKIVKIENADNTNFVHLKELNKKSGSKEKSSFIRSKDEIAKSGSSKKDNKSNQKESKKDVKPESKPKKEAENKKQDSQKVQNNKPQNKKQSNNNQEKNNNQKPNNKPHKKPVNKQKPDTQKTNNQKANNQKPEGQNNQNNQNRQGKKPHHKPNNKSKVKKEQNAKE